MSIDRRDVEQITHLVRLSFTEAEAQDIGTQLTRILDHFAQLDAVDVNGVEPTWQPVVTPNTMREDEPRDGLERSSALRNSPDRDAAAEGFFAMPAVLEDLADETVIDDAGEDA
jgi:aspartyl-tRNA(Asn)/glutamyl-tRNA(Gln) amidotransferase subunit C